MLQNRSVVQVVDNTEVLEVRCFQPRRGKLKLGDLITGSVLTVAPRRTQGTSHRRGDVVHAVIIGCRSQTRIASSGRRMSSGMNTCVLVTHSGKEGWTPVGTRVLSIVPRSLRLAGWGSLAALSTS